MSWDGFKADIIANRYQQTFIQGFLDVSGRAFVRNGDVSFNEGNLFVGANIRANRSLVVGYDSSLNGNVSIGNDLTIGGQLNVRQYSSQNIINTTTTNYQLIVSEDLSLNGKLNVSGNVGIGVTAPVYTLDVSSVSTQPFRVGVGSTNAIVVDNNGRVGIGITNPAYALDVSVGSGTKIHDMFINAQNNSTMAIGSLGIKNANNFATGFALYQGVNGDTVLNAYSGQQIDFKINNGLKVRIDSAGKVGIGSNIPINSLDVVGDIRGRNGSGNYVNLGSGAAASTRTLWLDYLGTGTVNDYGVIQAEQQGTAFRKLALNPNGGNVGIGITNPAVALDVTGNVRCSGGFELNYSSLPTYNSNHIGSILYSSSAATGGTTIAAGAYKTAYSFSSVPIGRWIGFINIFTYATGGQSTGLYWFATNNTGSTTAGTIDSARIDTSISCAFPPNITTTSGNSLQFIIPLNNTENRDVHFKIYASAAIQLNIMLNAILIRTG